TSLCAVEFDAEVATIRRVRSSDADSCNVIRSVISSRSERLGGAKNGAADGGIELQGGRQAPHELVPGPSPRRDLRGGCAGIDGRDDPDFYRIAHPAIRRGGCRGRRRVGDSGKENELRRIRR